MTQDVVVSPAATHKSLTALVGAKIRGRMAESGVTQVMVAAELHLSQQAISRRLAGLVPWDVNELEHLSHLLGTDPAELMDVARLRETEPKTAVTRQYLPGSDSSPTLARSA